MNYHFKDHTHCWQHAKPPCGQKIKHFECCLCHKLHPDIEGAKKPEKEDSDTISNFTAATLIGVLIVAFCMFAGFFFQVGQNLAG